MGLTDDRESVWSGPGRRPGNVNKNSEDLTRVLETYDARELRRFRDEFTVSLEGKIKVIIYRLGEDGEWLYGEWAENFLPELP